MCAMITLLGSFTPPGAVPGKQFTFSEPTKGYFMKVLLYFIGIAFAFVFSVSVSAKTSSGEIMTMCKSTVKESMDDVTRIRTSKFKERATGTKITFRVSSKENPTRKVTCTYANGVATLSDPIRLAASER